MLRWILIMGLGYQAYALFSEAKNRISFEFLLPQRGDIDLLNESITLRLRVINQNPIGFSIRKVKGMISRSGLTLGQIDSVNVHDIPANGSKDLHTEIQLTSENILIELAQSIATGQWSAPLYFSGQVQIENRTFEVNRKIALR